MQEALTINQFIRRLFPVPDALKVREKGKSRNRARALAVLLLTSSATVWFWTIILTALYLIFDFEIRLNVYFAYFVSAVLCLQIWAFYRFANLRLASMLFAFTYFLMALSLVLMSGGYHSPNLVILLSCPVVSFCAGGKDEGIMNSIFVGLAGHGLMVIDKMEVPMLNLLAGIDQHYFFAIAWVVTLAIIASCMVAYDLEDN